MAEFTRDEALAFVEAMRLAVAGKVGFGWMAERLSGLTAYIGATAAENEALNAFVDSAGMRAEFERSRASRDE